MFGVTHVMARDGFSWMIVASSTMPIKNNVIIYDEIYRKFTLEYGLWDQVRVDGGKEFVLICHMQDFMRDKRHNTSIDPFKSTKSTENNIIERMWVEVNSRVNYPLKSAFNFFVQNGDIDMTSEETKYAVSWVACHVSNVGLERFIKAWNHHSVPKKGKPIALMQQNNQIVPIQIMLTKEEAVEHYTNVNNGSLTEKSTFGRDLLDGFPDLAERRKVEIRRKFNFENIFSEILQQNTDSMLQCIQLFLQLTNALLIV